jgi:hypothetical protein
MSFIDHKRGLYEIKTDASTARDTPRTFFDNIKPHRMNSSILSDVLPEDNNSFTFIAKSFRKSREHDTPVFFGNERPKMASFGWKKISVKSSSRVIS